MYLFVKSRARPIDQQKESSLKPVVLTVASLATRWQAPVERSAWVGGPTMKSAQPGWFALWRAHRQR